MFKLLNNVPLTRYHIPENKTIIPYEIMKKFIDTFNEVPIIKNDSVIGMVVSADNIDINEKIVYGSIALYGENTKQERMAMSIVCNDYENIDGVAVIKDFRVMDVHVI